ncbi:hypothetical protein C0995_002018 [Termitomyces sp. Mi166|nr:hypothetical protein C0995_002018 [Termitomyces sp. Mi166\
MSSEAVNHVQESSSATRLSDSATFTGSPQVSKLAPEFHTSIPPATPERARTLVLCFDGTGDQFDSDNSNVVEFFSMLMKGDKTKQMVYYQAGIGTYISPRVATPLSAKISKILDGAIAWNLSAHVMDGYEFLMQNYWTGDRICIFGFSRGAYTARSLAGMIHKACHKRYGEALLSFFHRMYTRTDKVGWRQSNIFKKAFSIDVPIEFIGFWDTVNSVGLIPKRLPFTTSNTIVRTFRHAVALDERRVRFQANLWNRPNAKELTLGVQGQKPGIIPWALRAGRNSFLRGKKLLSEGKKHSLHALERKTDIEEVWFAGAHCDVGGGSVANGTPHSLARIPLRWMIRECFKAGTGIIFGLEDLRRVGLDPASLYPDVQKRPPPLPVVGAQIQYIPTATQQEELQDREEHELLDALSPIYDQLSLAPLWWILELLLIKQNFQKGDNSWGSTNYPNLGRGRYIRKQKKHVIKIHRSVRQRMEAQYPDGCKYEPKASFKVALELGNVEWVD